jgi:hypothetical protein
MQPLDHKDHPWNRIENFDLGWVHSTLKAAAKTKDQKQIADVLSRANLFEAIQLRVAEAKLDYMNRLRDHHIALQRAEIAMKEEARKAKIRGVLGQCPPNPSATPATSGTWSKHLNSKKPSCR